LDNGFFRAQKSHVNIGAIRGTPAPADKDRAIPEPGGAGFFSPAPMNPACTGYLRVPPGEKPPPGCTSEGAHALQGGQPPLSSMGEKPMGLMRGEVYPAVTSRCLLF